MELKSLSDLKPAPYNPREIDDKSLAALGVSLKEFGDISGLVHNRRTGNLVCGHQRLKALQEAHGDKLKLEGGAVVTPSGERFPVREVDVDEAREKAMNVAANSPLLAGQFTAGLAPILGEIKIALPELSACLRLDELKAPEALGDMLDAEPQIDKAEEINKVWQVRPGDMFGLGACVKCPQCGKMHSL